MTRPPPDALAAARSTGLRYVTDADPGITRRRCGRGFTYFDADGRRITDATERARIKALAVPPAWTEVWIGSDPRGHLLATGRDAKGRKQYRYHPEWQAARLRQRYAELPAFAAGLPALRQTVGRRLVRAEPDRDVVLAVAVYLLDRALIRVGNEAYHREHGTVGVSTLEREHVRIGRDKATFTYTAKSGRARTMRVDDPRVSRVLRRCASLPGQRLLTWRGAGGECHPIRSDDINAFIAERVGSDFTAKDFRTWGGTVAAYEALVERPVPEGEAAARSALKAAMGEVAARLGNTVAVCRRHYVHPAIPEAWRAGELGLEPPRAPIGLSRSERAVAALLGDD